jgi:hypothetical protein
MTLLFALSPLPPACTYVAVMAHSSARPILRLVPCHFHREHATLSPPAHPLLLRCWLNRSVGVWRAVKVSPHLRLNASQFLRISYASIVHSNGYHTYAVSRSIAPHLPSIVSHTLRSFFGHTTLPNRVVC